MTNGNLCSPIKREASPPINQHKYRYRPNTLKISQGLTLLETLAGLVVASLVLLVAIHTYRLVTYHLRLERAVEQVQLLTQASYRWLNSQSQGDFSGHDSGTDISLTQLIQTGLVHPEMGQSSLYNPWGGAVAVNPASDARHVQIVSSGLLTQTTCLALAQRLKPVTLGDAGSTSVCTKEGKGTYTYSSNF